MNNKTWWKKYNPSLKGMMEKRPNITILGLWWAWSWRLALLVIAAMVVLGILGNIFS